MLLITDDAAPPWPVFTGKLERVLEYLGQLPPVEYMLADPDLNWLLLDAHHDALLLLGSLIGIADRMRVDVSTGSAAS